VSLPVGVGNFLHQDDDSHRERPPLRVVEHSVPILVDRAAMMVS
jgi:hypothetical protein